MFDIHGKNISIFLVGVGREAHPIIVFYYLLNFFFETEIGIKLEVKEKAVEDMLS